MRLSLRDFQQLSSVEIFNGELLKGKTISGVSTDSRSVKERNIFFAIRGERFDGHKFVFDATMKNVAAVVVESAWSRNNKKALEFAGTTIIAVPDTTKALGELARVYRRKFSIPVLAIGGSNGKTTTKEMIGVVLRQRYNVLSTEGNLNNNIGVPQTLFKLTPKHEIVVLELGTNHPGEMGYLCSIAEPTQALVTNVGREHLEFFNDERGVVAEETDLFRSLGTKGFAFVNIDDANLSKAGKKIKHALRYGKTKRADIRARRISTDALGRPAFDVIRKEGKKSETIQLSIAGEHNVMNALAASAVGVKFKIPSKKIRVALEQFRAVNKRMETLSRNGIIILNDTYNANPDSVIAALRTLQSMKISGNKIVVLADMLELGQHAELEHAKIGLAVSDMDFEYLLTFGPLSRYTHEASKLPFAEHFDSKEILLSSLRHQLKPGDAVLIKGSRGMKMEEIVERL